jgi:hypothetical protein
MSSLLVPIWFAASALAHVHAGQPYYARSALAAAMKAGAAAPNAWLRAYLDWCRDTDARYCRNSNTSDFATLDVDSCVMAFEGLSCFVVSFLCGAVAIMHFTKSAYYHPLRLATCVCHIYGALTYIISARFNLNSNSVGGAEPFSKISPANFWPMFIGMNSVWIVLPALLARNSALKMAAAMRIAEEKP